jgi:hypothetical protein
MYMGLVRDGGRSVTSCQLFGARCEARYTMVSEAYVKLFTASTGVNDFRIILAPSSRQCSLLSLLCGVYCFPRASEVKGFCRHRSSTSFRVKEQHGRALKLLGAREARLVAYYYEIFAVLIMPSRTSSVIEICGERVALVLFLG